MNMSFTAFIEGELLFIKNFEKEWAAKGVELSAHRDEFIELPEN
jgi:hypothetical protein